MKAYAFLVVGLLVTLLTSPEPAHAIVMSRGIQDVNVSYEECLGRAYQSFVAEGYNSTPSRGEGFVSGFKANHGAYINCTGIPGRGTSVIIVVASEGVADPGVPGAERVRLQQRMALQAPPPVTPPVPPTPPPPPPPGAVSATWHTSGADHEKAPDGQRFGYACPPGGTDVRSIWGFDVYTFDSGICLAGVQAGVITRQSGGPVTIEMRPGLSSYATGSRNGVTSQPYNSPYPKSFVVVGAPGGAGYRVSSPPPPAPPAGPAAGQPRYLGCFKDPNNPFDLDGRVERSAQNTPQHCIQSCAAQGFKYAGVQYGQSCLCGNSYGRFGQANNCNMRCTGDGNQICGGSNANSVYSTGR